MRKILSIMLAIVMIASVAVVSVSAADGVATVTLKSVTGEEVTKTYAVGDTVTAYTYLNASEINDGKMGSINGTQFYSNAVLELADEYDPDEGDIADLDAMFPITKDATVASGNWTESEEDPAMGAVYFNASTASYAGFVFNSDTSALIITNYKVKAAGTAVIENVMTTLAASNYELYRVIDGGVIKDDNFASPVALSDPTIPVETGSVVSGKVTSFKTTDGEGDDVVTLKLTGVDNDFTDTVTVTAEYTANKAETDYSFADVPAGDYTLSVEKKNHVTREYAVTVSEDTALDAKICPKGDANLNGSVQANDAMLAYRGSTNTYTFTDDYAKKCADANGNGYVQANDAMMIYRQSTGKHTLF
ncbi:MAG: hypothetical protein IJH07_10370 [Ruminococcus sp.]|nr:hypothetical protein [Ruminococcus sp.]